MSREFIKNVIPRKGTVAPFSQCSLFNVVCSKPDYLLTSRALKKIIKKSREQKKYQAELTIDFPKYKVICKIEEK